MPGGFVADNLTQNYPLRVLSGELLRHGRLPLWDPYIWSGTPLLAGWNAGALYPGTWLFAVLPAAVAWTLNVISVFVVCGVGMHVFLRRLGCSPLASLLGALTFSFTGYMSGQAVHIGLVAGMSFTPWMLLAVHELGAAPGPVSARRWIALLGGCGGLVVLAGDPRAASNVAIVTVTYFLAVCWRSWRAGRRVNADLVVGVALAALLAVCLSAAQWLPGLSFLHESERAAVTFARFATGSLSWRDLTLLFVPFLVGGFGKLGLPTYAGTYNLPELSYAVGIMPLVATFALLKRAFRSRAQETQLGVWYALIIIGLVLSDARTPIGRLLIYMPLYGGQRLQNRNIVLVDLALAVLLALFVDILASRKAQGDSASVPPRGPDQALTYRERMTGLVPVGIVAVLILAAYVAGHWIQRIMGVSGYHANLAARLTPYFVVTLLIAAGAALVLTVSSRLSPGGRRRLVATVVTADVLLSLIGGSYSFPAKSTIAYRNQAVVKLASLLGPQGRYAIFNPAQALPSALSATILDLGPYSLGILHQVPSIQGYSSAVAGSYQQATGAKDVENLQPDALTRSDIDILDLKDLVTLPEYLVSEIPDNQSIPVATGVPVPPGAESVATALDAIAPQKPLPHLPPFLLSPGRSSTWILPGPIALDSITIVLLPHNNEVPRTVAVGILDARNQIVGDRQEPVVNSEVQIPLSKGRVAYGIQVRAPADSSAVIGAVAVSTARPTSVNSGPLTHRLVLNQVLQGLLEPPRWRYQTEIGGLPVFANTRTRGAAWVEPRGSTTPLASLVPLAQASTPSVQAWQNPRTVVSSPRRAVLIRSVAYDKGWVAKLVPVGGGQPVTEKVRPLGLLQAISIPPGRFVVTWVYTAKLAKLGVIVSGVGVLGLVLLVFLPRRRRRARSDSRSRVPGTEPGM